MIFRINTTNILGIINFEINEYSGRCLKRKAFYFFNIKDLLISEKFKKLVLLEYSSTQ